VPGPGRAVPAFEIRDRHRRAQQVALQRMATAAREKRALFLVLQAFGHDLELELARKRDDRLDDRTCVRVDVHAVHEGAVDPGPAGGKRLR
jgi:hypothetical protein